MKKFIIMLMSVCVIASVVPVVKACHFRENASSVKSGSSVIEQKTKVLPTMDSEVANGNTIWVGTFQIVWNEVINNIVKGPLEFIGGTKDTGKSLNKREFNKTDISEDSYYTKFGIVSPKLKKEIETGIKEKFNETSDILGLIDFTYDPQKMLIYAMLKKDFKFLEAFEKLDEETFGTNPKKVKYFGVKADSSYKLYKNLTALFYNSKDDYAVKLHTKSNDEVILYRTDDVQKLNEYFEDIKTKSDKYEGEKYFGHNDRFKVPEISLYEITNFKEVEGKSIKGTDFRIDKTIETIDFKMDNEGVKLKSEAAMMMATSAAPGFRPQIRYFYFNKNFVLFLIEKDKHVPYFAMRVVDVAKLNETGKN